MWDVVELVGAFGAAMLVTYTAIVVVFAISAAAKRIAR